MAWRKEFSVEGTDYKKDTLTYATEYAEFQWFLDDFLPEEERVYLKPEAKELQPYDILNPWIDLNGNELTIKDADAYYSHDAIQEFIDDVSKLDNTILYEWSTDVRSNSHLWLVEEYDSKHNTVQYAVWYDYEPKIFARYSEAMQYCDSITGGMWRHRI